MPVASVRAKLLLIKVLAVKFIGGIVPISN